MVGNVVAADAMMSGGDGQPETLAGVTVTLDGEHAMGETMETDMSGGFAFTGLRAGTYTVTISDFPEDVSFEAVSMEVEVDVGEVGQADFTGHFIRTSAVGGQVIIEGEGLAGVTVTLSGGPADESYTAMTDADGMYRFEDLRPGDYTVSISDFDTRDYEFASTSQDVSVDLDETETVSFTGVLLRTSGISGRVSVEGMGLDSIEVTLSGGDDSRTAMTHGGGQYSFAGLAAGDYTVSIAVDSDAYVFDSMSSDVTVGDDQSAIVNFDGQHARTASVSGMVFIDEATKNDMYDEGEAPLAHAGIPVALVGPGVNEQRMGATDDTGAFSFTGLRSGHYQLVVNVNMTVAAALAANDLAYGGPGTGYSINLGVGEAASQAIPFDITHTTVNFTVSLKHGDDMGAALEGAMVTLYGANDARVGTGMTGEDGSVAIKVARAGTSGNMVKAGVSAEGYDVAEGMTDVSWNPQMFATEGSNDNDIVNLNVNVSVSGATVTTDHEDSGKPLGGWALSVMSGGAAVAGAPTELDTEGNASFTAEVTKADLPVSYSFNVADDQEDSMDGGESYEGTAATYEHDGLKLAGTMDAGTIEVRYTTQTLRVYVHNEKDQVFGFTGNIVGGDGSVSMQRGSSVQLEIEYEEGGRDHSFDSDEWNADLNTHYRLDEKVRGSNGDEILIRGHGSWRRVDFRHLPADKNIRVSARVRSGEDLMVLDKAPHNDQLDTFQDLETNGVMGGAFGAQGGFSPRVSLCPLQERNPQNFDACSSFAVVNLYTVTGDVTMRDVKRERNGDDFDVDTADDPSFVEDFTAALVPKSGENFGGERVSFTTTKDDDDDTDLDERTAFMFENVAAGAYSIADPSGWSASVTDDDGRSTVDPIGSNVNIAFRPSTRTFYGRVMGADEFPVSDVTVTVNGQSDVTDGEGRYIVKGVGLETYYEDNDRMSGFFVSHSRSERVDTIARGPSSARYAAPNSPKRHNINLASTGKFATISGTVTASGSGAAIAGAKVEVDYGDGDWVAPTNPNAKAKRTDEANNIYETGSDGTYSIEVEAQGLGGTVAVRVTKSGMSFVPPSIPGIPAHDGSNVRGFDFTGFLHATISGRVQKPGGGPMEGVLISAMKTGETVAADTFTTRASGTFRLDVSFGTYTLTAVETDYAFIWPTNRPGGVVSVTQGQGVSFGTIKAPGADYRISRLRVTRASTADGGAITATWRTNISDQVGSDGTALAGTDQVQVCTAATCGESDWANDGSAATTVDDNAGSAVTLTNTGGALDGSFRVRIVTTLTGTGLPSAGVGVNSSTASVTGLDPKATNVDAERDGDDIDVTWEAETTSETNQRVVMEVEISAGTKEWLVAVGTQTGTEGTDDEFSWALTIPAAGAPALTWTRVNGTGTTNVTREALLKALVIRVEAQHGDNGDWIQGGSTNLPAAP